MSRFFVSCPLDYENELVAEMKSFWFEMIDLDGLPTRAEFPEIEILRGGIQMNVADHLGFQINFFSKIANRVLLRIFNFEARYYDQFEKGFAKVEFEKYLPGETLKLKVESHKSRLNNDKNIIEAAGHVLSKKKIKLTDDSPNTVFIRLDKDRVMISLDTSGEHLHRRGYAVFRGEAPMRETLAAYIVRKLGQQVSLNRSLTIIDPFVGSGTLLFEASSFRQPNLNRHFPWLDFKTAPKLFKSETWKKNYRWFEQQNVPQCLGFDNDDKALNSLAQNRIEFEKLYGRPADITAEFQDSRDLKLDRSVLRKAVWVITNPPYGIRLADENAKEVLENIESTIDGLVVVHPVGWQFDFKKLKQVLIEDFSNQGLNLKLSVYKRF